MQLQEGGAARDIGGEVSTKDSVDLRIDTSSCPVLKIMRGIRRKELPRAG